MSLLRRHPWIPLALLSLAGIAVSLTMLYIACTHPSEAVPVERPVAP